MKFYITTALTLLFALVLNLSPIMAQQLKGNGEVKTQIRNVSGFSGINISGGFNVEIKQGNTESVTLETDENLLDNIKTEVRNGVLHIHNSKGMSTSKGLMVYLTLKELNKVDVSGGVKVTGSSTFTTHTLDIDLSGGSKAYLALDVKYLKADMSGASRLTLTGKAETATLELSGASNVEAKELEAINAKVRASGASKVKINAIDTLAINASGASIIHYKGNPNISPVTSSAARILRLK
jgi:hypothetical protein